MHTVITSFSTRAEAERAMDRLAGEGVDRERMHLQHRDLPEQGLSAERWDVMEREVAVDRGTLESIGHFFVSLFGKDHPEGHAQRYSEAVHRGECVLVVDAPNEAEARRAADFLGELGGQDRSVIPRSRGGDAAQWAGEGGGTQREGRVISEPMAGRLDAGGQIDRSDPAEHNHVIAGAQRELKPVMDAPAGERPERQRPAAERAGSQQDTAVQATQPQADRPEGKRGPD